MIFTRGMRDKLSKYTDTNLEINIKMSVTGPDVYDFCCFGVDKNNQLSDDRYMIFYNQTFSPNNEITYILSGNTADFTINLSKLPQNIDKLVFTVSIDGNGTMGKITDHTFSVWQNNAEQITMNLTGKDFNLEKAIISVEIYRKGEWRISAVANGFNGGLSALLAAYGGTEEGSETQTSNSPSQPISGSISTPSVASSQPIQSSSVSTPSIAPSQPIRSGSVSTPSIAPSQPIQSSSVSTPSIAPSQPIQSSSVSIPSIAPSQPIRSGSVSMSNIAPAQQSPYNTQGYQSTQSQQSPYNTQGYQSDQSQQSPYNTQGYQSTQSQQSPYNTQGYQSTQSQQSPYNTQGYQSAQSQQSPYNTQGYQSDQSQQSSYNTQGYQSTQSQQLPYNTQGYQSTTQSVSRPVSIKKSEEQLTQEVMNKISLSKDKVNLEKHVISLSKCVVDLSKKGKVDLGSMRAKVVVVLDYSGSMSSLYSNGTVQNTINRLVPLGLTFDDNGTIDVFLFQSDYRKMEDLNLSNYEYYVQNVIKRSGYSMGGTNYAPVLRAIIDGDSKRKGGFLGIGRKTVATNPIVDNGDPTFILFITDGENGDRSATDNIIIKCSTMNVFIQFIGIGNSSFTYLKKLDEFPARARDNTGFTKMADLNRASDQELYTNVLEQFSAWLNNLQ